MGLTTTCEYRWDDPSAPVLTGQAGSFTALMKALLVGNGSGVAYGSGANEKAAAGWSVSLEDVANHKLALRNSLAAGGTGCLLRIQDNGPGSGGTREARIQCFATMSNIDTGTVGTGAFPVRKSTTTDGTARRWVVYADERTVWWSINTSSTNFTVGGAGDGEPLIAGDPYCYFAAGSGLENNEFNSALLVPSRESYATFANRGGFSFASDGFAGASPQGVGIPIFLTNAGSDSMNISAIGSGASGSTYPLPPGVQNQFLQAFAAANGLLRARLRGLYVPLQRIIDRDIGDAFDGSLAPGGRLATLRGQTNGSNYYIGGIAVESRLPW